MIKSFIGYMMFVGVLFGGVSIIATAHNTRLPNAMEPTIIHNAGVPPRRLYAPKYIYPRYISDDEYMLAKAIYYEAGGECLNGKYLVGDAILNRVDSSLFPNTLSGVIYQQRPSRQFEFTKFDSAKSKIKLRADNDTERQAVRDSFKVAWEILYSSDYVRSPVLYFHAKSLPEGRTLKWFRTKDELFTVGRHIFYGEPNDT